MHIVLARQVVDSMMRVGCHVSVDCITSSTNLFSSSWKNTQIAIGVVGQKCIFIPDCRISHSGVHFLKHGGLKI
jgi:hypothetical protein